MESKYTKKSNGLIRKSALFAGLLLSASSNTNAAEISPLFSGSVEVGGDDISTSEGDITGGGVIQVGLGLAIYGRPGAMSETHITANLKVDSAASSNGAVSFYRWPIEVIQYFKTDKFRFGVGLSYHLSPELDCDITNQCNYTVSFDNALGYVAAVDYRIPVSGTGKLRGTTVGLRYTNIEYEYSDFPSASPVDGSSIGLAVGLAY